MPPALLTKARHALDESIFLGQEAQKALDEYARTRLWKYLWQGVSLATKAEKQVKMHDKLMRKYDKQYKSRRNN